MESYYGAVAREFTSRSGYRKELKLIPPRTGMLHANTTAWRAQQRHRIAHLVNHPSGTRQVIVEEEGYLGSPVAEMREYPTSDLVEKYTNISFIGQSNKPPFVSGTTAIHLCL